MHQSRLDSRKVGPLSIAISIALCSLTASVQAQTVEAVNSGDWVDPATWDNGQPASPGNAYRIGDGFTVSSPAIPAPGDYVRDFSGDSLTVLGGGTLELRSISERNDATGTYSIPGLSFQDNSSLYLSARIGNIYRILTTSVDFTSGDVIVYNNPTTFSNNLTFDTTAAITGTANVHLNLDVTGNVGIVRNALIVNSANNSFSGDWILTSVRATGERHGALIAGAQNALGTGNVVLVEGSALVNSVAGGLDSLQSVSVGQNSVINVDASWTNPNAAVSLLNDTSSILLTGPSTVSMGALNGVAGSSISGDDSQQSFSVTSTASDQFDGTIAGALHWVKAGPGTLTLGGSNTYTGTTTVLAGRLNINGDQTAASGTTTVAAGATLGGSGVIGGDVVLADDARIAPGNSVGTLTLNGDLVASSGSVFEYELGQAGTVGGPLNDLLLVGGDLTLDGVLEVQTSPGGQFAPGVYRLISYGGQLTDQALEIGAAPATDLRVQTAVPGQVNLINSTGLTLGFWDGAPLANKNNGIIEGGDGVWQASAGNENWTDSTGIVNAPFADGTFAVFGGSPGTVTVDDSLGPVGAAGLQFLVNGYTLGGDALNLIGPTSYIRVGDGTSASTGVSATLNNAITGTTLLTKTDPGTLILAGNNTYSGGTSVQGGVLQISGDAQLGAAGSSVWLNNATLRTTQTFTSNRPLVLEGLGGTIDVTPGSTYSLGGDITGDGGLWKTGAGTLSLLSAVQATGPVTIVAGRLAAGGDAVLNGHAALTIGAAGTLDLASHAQTVAELATAGAIEWGDTPGTTLTIATDYLGQGGRLILNTVLGDDDSLTDRLVVGGATSGTGLIEVINRGGPGAQTLDGIKLIEVQGDSAGQFSLLGDYRLRDEAILVAGAYGYRLAHNGITDPEDGDWYLRSSLIDPVDPGPDPEEPPPPLYQAGVPLYEVYAEVLKNLSAPKTLAQRVGQHGVQDPGDAEARTLQPWVQAAGRGGEHVPERSSTAASFKDQGWELEAGLDMTLRSTAAGVLIAGASAHYLDGSANVRSPYGDGRIESTGYGVAGTLTWYGSAGTYVDMRLGYSWVDSDLRSHLLQTPLVEGNDATRLAASVEVGIRLPMNDAWALVPQAQLSHVRVDYDHFDDPFDAAVSLDRSEALVPRVGLATEYTSATSTPDAPRWSGYALVDLSYDTGVASRTTVAETPISHDNATVWGRAGAGARLHWGTRYALDFQLSYAQSLANHGDSHSASGSVNFRAAW